MPTKIEWTDETWNPATGCTRVSEGCKNCYAKRMARRLAGRYGYPKVPHHFDVVLHLDRLLQPPKWKKSRRVFVCSMGDLFHENVPNSFIECVFNIMVGSSQHIFQVLTKRPLRMRNFIKTYYPGLANARHIWLGVSVENQATADERIPLLLQTPAAVRFVSCEPLLGPADLSKWLRERRGGYFPIGLPRQQPCLPSNWHQPPLDWIIVGGESGPSARPMHPQWARDIRDQCQAASIPYFHKQNGEWLPGCKKLLEEGYGKVWTVCLQNQNDKQPQIMWRVGRKRAGRLLDGEPWEEMPE